MASRATAPAAVFRTPRFGPKVAWGWLVGLLPMVGIVLMVVGPFGGQLGEGSVVAVLLFSLVVYGPIAVRFAPRALAAYRRSRLSEEERTVMRVGPDGIWLPGMGSVAWNRVRAIRSRIEGSSPVGLGGQIPRWGLFIEPEPGSVPTAARSRDSSGDFAVFADQLDVPFDDVVDLVRYYHPIEEID